MKYQYLRLFSLEGDGKLKMLHSNLLLLAFNDFGSEVSSEDIGCNDENDIMNVVACATHNLL